MSWTAPRTWVTSEVISAAIMNTHVRDNLLETAPAKASAAGQMVFSTAANAIAMVTGSKYKTADESVNNSTTLQNDDHLAWAVAANEVWAWAGHFYITIASGNPLFKMVFAMPVGGDGTYTAFSSQSNVPSAGTIGIAAYLMSTSQSGFGSGLTSLLVELVGVYIGGANAGTVQLQWAQNAAVASNLTLKLGSYIDLKRLA